LDSASTTPQQQRNRKNEPTAQTEGTQLTLGNTEGDLVRALRESIQQTTNRAGQRLIERQLDVQPTITVRPGWPVRVIVAKDLVFR
jgi:type IV secretory pathway VirB10-like protein